MKWIVAYNLHTQEWLSGGTREDYPYPHNDIFEVEAQYRDQAEEKGKIRRRAQVSLTKLQRTVLDGLKEELRVGGEECRHHSIEILPDEIKQAKALADKGLLYFSSDDETYREVFLTADAFNPSLDADDLRLARSTEHRLEKRTAPAVGRRSKPGRL